MFGNVLVNPDSFFFFFLLLEIFLNGLSFNLRLSWALRKQIQHRYLGAAVQSTRVSGVPCPSPVWTAENTKQMCSGELSVNSYPPVAR